MGAINYKKEIIRGVEYKYSSSMIHLLEDEIHWRHYWQQQKLMYNHVKTGDHILEIGIGSGFTSKYLRSKGVRVTTLDIDPEKKPDIVANIVNFDWSTLKFDHILAFEVFEHIPLEELSVLLPKLSTVFSGYLFMSVPNNARVLLDIDIKVAKMKKKLIST